MSDLEFLSSLKARWKRLDHQDKGLGSTSGTVQYATSYARTRDIPTACVIARLWRLRGRNDGSSGCLIRLMKRRHPAIGRRLRTWRGMFST